MATAMRSYYAGIPLKSGRFAEAQPMEMVNSAFGNAGGIVKEAVEGFRSSMRPTGRASRVCFHGGAVWRKEAMLCRVAPTLSDDRVDFDVENRSENKGAANDDLYCTASYLLRKIIGTLPVSPSVYCGYIGNIDCARMTELRIARLSYIERSLYADS